MIQLFLSKVYTQENWKQFLHKNLYANVHSEVKWKSLSRVQLFATPLTKQSMEFFRSLEWVAFPFSRGSSQPRDRTQVSQIAGRFFTSWATREAQCSQ